MERLPWFLIIMDIILINAKYNQMPGYPFLKSNFYYVIIQINPIISLGFTNKSTGWEYILLDLLALPLNYRENDHD